MKKFVFAMITLVASMNLYAAVPVALLPFEGDSAAAKKAEAMVKDLLVKTDGISVVADNLMAEIVRQHEKGQALGSTYHDMSKLKVAAFLITGGLTGNRLMLKAVDVNEGTEIYSGSVDLSASGYQYSLKRSVKDITDRIFLGSTPMVSEAPSASQPYMDVINRLISSLGRGDEASYPFIAIYLGGTYRHPEEKDPKSAEIAKGKLKLMRQSLIRSQVTFINMKNEGSWFYVDVVADKAGKKTKVRFGFLELEDGSLAIGIYEEGK
jgi:hypothetical protein